MFNEKQLILAESAELWRTPYIKNPV